MTTYRGPNAFRNGTFKPAKPVPVIGPYVRSPSGEVRKANGPAFNNKFPKSRYRGGGQSGVTPVLEIPSEGPPAPPEGFAYLVNGDGAYILNADDAYILAKVS